MTRFAKRAMLSVVVALGLATPFIGGQQQALAGGCGCSGGGGAAGVVVGANAYGLAVDTGAGIAVLPYGICNMYYYYAKGGTPYPVGDGICAHNVKVGQPVMVYILMQPSKPVYEVDLL